MSDIGSLTSLTGSSPLGSKGHSGMRTTSPEPATVQSAVAQPLTTPQSAVTQSPATGNAEWQRNADLNNHQQNSQPGAALTHQQLTDTVEHLNQHLREYNTNLQFEVDDKYQQMVVRIVDRETQEVVRQIPSETALALAKFFEEQEAEQSQGPPGGMSNGKESRRLKAEGWLLQATA